MMSSEKTNNSGVISGEIDGADPDGGDRRRGSRGYWRGHQRDRAGGPASEPASGNTAAASDWKPQFFNDREWAFINAAVARLIPADELGPGAKEAGVPEFIDRQLNTPYATGSIWYMQGPSIPTCRKRWVISCRWCPNRSITSGSPTPRRGVRTNIIKPSLN